MITQKFELHGCRYERIDTSKGTSMYYKDGKSISQEEYAKAKVLKVKSSVIDEHKYRIKENRYPQMPDGHTYEYDCCDKPNVYRYPKAGESICETCGFIWTNLLGERNGK